MRRTIIFFLAAAMLVGFMPLVYAEETLSDEELTELLYTLSQEGENTADFVVLPEDYVEPVTGLDGTYSLLLIGVDTDGRGVSGRSDTMVLAVMNKREETVKLISFLRDLYVQIPGKGHNRLNAADGYLAVDFGLMIRLVDAVGGIELEVNEDELQPLNGILEYYNQQHGWPVKQGRLQKAGYVRLTGLQAMSYARIRKMDSDFMRVIRQQKTLAAILIQLQRMEAPILFNLVMEYASLVKTDIAVADVFQLIPLLLPMADYDLSTLSIPVAGGSKNTMKNNSFFLLPNLKKNVLAIEQFLNPTD
jgi:anionic cell wall polymer biosynthesis LytR-Cps2A-Psr (LCP) family protein